MMDLKVVVVESWKVSDCLDGVRDGDREDEMVVMVMFDLKN